MFISRRKFGLAGLLTMTVAGMAGHRAAWAQSGEQAAVNDAVDALTKAMLTADKSKLEELVADQLSYGHSGGVVESKAQFLEVVAGKKTVYKTINISDASTVVVGNNAIARHIFAVETESGGKAGSARVGVMQVWVKQNGGWKLLARQAFRLPS